MSTYLNQRTLSRLVSRLDQYGSTYQLIQNLLLSSNENFDSKGFYRSGSQPQFISINEAHLTVEEICLDRSLVSSTPIAVSDKDYLSELARSCLQEYNWLRNQTYQVWSRSATIPPQVTGILFEVHNGIKFEPIPLVTSNIVGHKFGEFVQTRKPTIHKQQKKNNR